MTACTCPHCPNCHKPAYAWNRVWNVIERVRADYITSPGAVIALKAELDQMSTAQRQRVRDEVSEHLELLGVGW